MKPYKETSYSTLQDSSEDGIDVEVTDYKTVDDNLDFNTRYTTALKERATGRMVAIVTLMVMKTSGIANTVLSMVFRII